MIIDNKYQPNKPNIQTMQLIDNNNRLTFGKYKGHLTNLAPESWLNWAMLNVPQFKQQYEAYKPRFKKPIGNETMLVYKPYRKTFRSRAVRPKNY